jgi:TetR/AcrR family transcriptional regulator, transcriptional repressor for nem operon
MRKSKQDARETRERIVKTAGEEFRKRGIGETSLADLMAAAGLTHGGFYRHFDSKDQLVAEACAEAVEAMRRKIVAAVAANPDRSVLETLAAIYLSPEHRDHPAEGCAVAALGSEIAHYDIQARTAATAGFLNLVEILADQFAGMPPEVAKSRAMAAVATMVGALMISRITPDPELSAAILNSATEELTSRVSQRFVAGTGSNPVNCVNPVQREILRQD